MGLALALFTVSLWAVLPLALKALLRSLDAATIVAFRFLVSALLVALVLGARRRLPDPRRLAGGGVSLLAAAALGLGLNYILYMAGLELTTPATAQVVIQLAPPLFGLGALALFRERFTRLQWSGFAGVLAGLALFSWERVDGADLADGAAGIGWVALAAVAWAAYGLAQKQLLVRLPSQGIMLFVYGACAVGFAPLARPAALLALGGAELALLLFCAVNTALAYGAFSEALAHWEASRVSAVLAATPLATIAAARAAAPLFPQWVEPDPLSAPALAGALLVVAGSITTALAGRQPAAPTPRAREAHLPGTGSR